MTTTTSNCMYFRRSFSKETLIVYIICKCRYKVASHDSVTERKEGSSILSPKEIETKRKLQVYTVTQSCGRHHVYKSSFNFPFLFQKSLYSFRDLKEIFSINHLKCWSLVREKQIETGKTII